MAVWNVDLTTEDGAWSAAQLGGYACFVAAVLTVLGLVFTWGLIQTGAIMPLAGLATLVQILVYVVAGLRLHAGKGVIWGIAAAALLAIECAFKVATVAISIGLVVNLLVLVVTINGVRGARALRGARFEGDPGAVLR